MNKKEILKWVLIFAAAGLFMLLTFPVSSLHCDKSQDVCKVYSKTLLSGDYLAVKFNISEIVSAGARKRDNFYYPSLLDKNRELYSLEVFPTKTQEGAEEIVKHIMNDDKYDIEGSFFKILNKAY